MRLGTLATKLISIASIASAAAVSSDAEGHLLEALPPDMEPANFPIPFEIPLVTEEEWAAHPSSMYWREHINETAAYANETLRADIEKRSGGAFHSCELLDYMHDPGFIFVMCRRMDGLLQYEVFKLSFCIANLNGWLSWRALGNYHLSCNWSTIYMFKGEPRLFGQCRATNGEVIQTALGLNHLTNIDGDLWCEELGPEKSVRYT